MALNPEEIQKRKAQRAQRRAKQQAQRKKLLTKLAIAGGVLLVTLIVIIVIAASSGKKDTGATDPSQLTTIHLAAAGDLNINDAVVASGGAEQDYSNLFMDVAHLLADADISVVNLEGVVCGEPYGDSRSAPVTLIQALAKAGVDLVQLANSYSVYGGVSGLTTTIENIRAVGMEPVGVFKDSDAYERSGGFTLCEVQGIKIAFVAFTKGMDGMLLPPNGANCVNLLYKDYATTYQKIDRSGITKVLDAVKEEDPDLTVALLHWGSKKADNISASQQEIQDLLTEHGVDVIIGTHPNYVQKMELTSDHTGFVAYSLGQFIGEGQKDGSEYSVILNLEITKNNATGKTTITGYEYTPVFTVMEEGKYVRVMRIRETMAAYESGYINKVADTTYQDMAYALERIAVRIKGE